MASAAARTLKKRSTPWWAWLAGALALAGAIGIGLYFARTGEKPVSALPGESVALPTTQAATETPPPIQHPIEQAATGATAADAPPLPALDASDASVIEALGGFAGSGALSALLNPEHVIQRIVATVDSLPRKKIAADAMPVRGAQGAFAIAQHGTERTIDAKNSARYAAYARIAQAIDAKALVAWYVKFYPLFQESYRELGYKDGYFNDRLVFVIDHLLATPDIAQPVELTQPNVMYEYADPALESRSAGQKLLMRSGPANEAAIKAKLREIRAALTGQALPPAGQSANPLPASAGPEKTPAGG